MGERVSRMRFNLPPFQLLFELRVAPPEPSTALDLQIVPVLVRIARVARVGRVFGRLNFTRPKPASG